jgi:hypothetical protein
VKKKGKAKEEIGRTGTKSKQTAGISMPQEDSPDGGSQ